MQAQAHRSSSTTTAAIDLAATSLLFGASGEKTCGWFDSSQALREGLQVRELSDRELMALWQQLKGATGAALH